MPSEVSSFIVLDRKRLEPNVCLKIKMAAAAVRKEVAKCKWTFFHLPREDVVFQHVFSRLDIVQLFQCRRVCKLFKEICEAYFRAWKVLDCASVASRMTEQSFELITRDSTKLQQIILKYCKSWLRESSFVEILKRNDRVQKLDLTGCSSLTNVSLFSLASFCLSLKELWLRECRWVSVEALSQLAMNCNKLEFIDLTGCWQVTDNCVCLLATFCENLRYITLNDCYSISNCSVEVIAKSCPRLVHIGIRGCWRVTNSAVSLLGEYCKQLKSLQVKDCRDITEVSLARLRVRGVQIDVEQPSKHRRWIDHLDAQIHHEQQWVAPAINLNI